MAAQSIKKEIFNTNLICPLCGIQKACNNKKRYTHREHLPPKSIFTKKSNDLITVSSCKKCNLGTSRYDEQFKILLGIYLGSKNDKLWQETLRTLNYANNEALKKEILSNISPVLIRQGKLGYIHPFEIDMESINALKAVIGKITRGLYWYVTKNPLPSDIKISTILLQQDSDCNEETKKTLNNYGKWIQTGNGIFQAQYALAKDRKYSSIWLMRFYNEDCFIVITKSKNKDD